MELQVNERSVVTGNIPSEDRFVLILKWLHQILSLRNSVCGSLVDNLQRINTASTLSLLQSTFVRFVWRQKATLWLRVVRQKQSTSIRSWYLDSFCDLELSPTSEA